MIYRYAESPCFRWPHLGLSLRVWIVALAALFLSASGLRADATYTYTGSDFTSFADGMSCPGDCSIDGSFTLSSPLTAGSTTDLAGSAFVFDFFVSSNDSPSWTNSDGITTVPNFTVTTNSAGQVVSWTIELEQPSGPDMGLHSTDGDNVEFTLGSVDSNTTPGTWTSPIQPTPEPSSLTLFLLGGLVMGMIAYRARRGGYTTPITHGFLHRT